MKTIEWKIIKCQKGAAAVEFAIIAPLLFTILFGIIEFSLLLYDKAVITNASREGARYGILWGPNRPTDAEILAKVGSYTSDRLITFGTMVSPTTTIVRSGSDPGDALTVTVVYNYDFLLLPNFISALSNVTTLSAETVMRLE
ncbi:MAG: TadE/TadG family type IV pilus assembly protein [Planctomycetota bacterium]|jgi:Flp pilus assembly protein TadG